MGVLLWPAVACRSAPLTWGSVRPPAASLCSPADCSGQAERSSQPSQAPRGPGLDLGSLPWQHTVDKCVSNGGKLVNSINTPEIIRRGRGGVGVRKWLILRRPYPSNCKSVQPQGKSAALLSNMTSDPVHILTELIAFILNYIWYLSVHQFCWPWSCLRAFLEDVLSLLCSQQPPNCSKSSFKTAGAGKPIFFTKQKNLTCSWFSLYSMCVCVCVHAHFCIKKHIWRQKAGNFSYLVGPQSEWPYN